MIFIVTIVTKEIKSFHYNIEFTSSYRKKINIRTSIRKRGKVMDRKIFIGSIAVSIIIVLASLPSVAASQTHQPSEITLEIRERLVKKLSDINSDYPLDWSPGLVIKCFFITLRLYIDYLSNNSWFPGLTFIIIYLFLVLVVLSIIGSP